MRNFKQRVMVTELKEVISKVEKLDEEEQKRIAKLLKDEINLDTTLQNSPEQLSKLTQEALDEQKVKYDENYLKGLREKAKKSWLANINPDEWLKKVRGGYEQ
jgi:signal transduction histidine kinase